MNPFTKKTPQTNILKGLLKGIINISMSIVDVGLMTSHISKSAKRLKDIAHNTASASEEMSLTVQGIATNSTDASETAGQVGQEVKSAIRIMEIANEKMANTAAYMEKLKIASEKIQNVINTINEITDQTNLLALNASIEAARAGEAGRGFAVVADEVRKLANQSQSATAEISDTVSSIQEEVGKVASSVEESRSSVSEGTEKISSLGSSAENIQQLMESVASSTREQFIAAQQVAESITHISKEAEENENRTVTIMERLDSLTNLIEAERANLAEQSIEGKVVMLAQADHALWKKKIVDFEMKRIDLDPSTIGDHTTCRLGKWYYGEGKKSFAHDDTFRKMEEAHIRVHEAAKEAASRRKTSPDADVNDMVQKLEAASIDVVTALKELEKK